MKAKAPDIGITELMLAASRGDLAGVHAALASGVEVNSQDMLGHTALWFAVSAGQVDVGAARE